MFGIAADILVVRYDSDSKDHDKSLQKVPQTCTEVSLKTEQRQMLFQIHISTIFSVKLFTGTV